MKKLMLIVVSIATLVLLLACAAAPAPAPAPEPEPEPVAPAPEPPPPAPAPVAEVRYVNGLILDGAGTYTVVRGDTLSRISRRRYNNGFYYPVIFMASRDIVRDQDRIIPGMVLTIPDLQRNLNDPTARENIRASLRESAVIEDQRRRPRTARGLRDLTENL